MFFPADYQGRVPALILGARIGNVVQMLAIMSLEGKKGCAKPHPYQNCLFTLSSSEEAWLS